MKINNEYLDSLIRDSEKLRIIESLLESQDVYVTNALIRAIVGIAPEKLEIPDVEEPGSLPFVDVPEKTPEETPEESSEKKTSEKKAAKPERTKIDRGKVKALHEAGWSNAKIADDMGCAVSTVSMIVNKVGAYAND